MTSTAAPAGLVMLERATLSDVDFRRVAFDHFAPRGCVFENCDFRGVALERRIQPIFSSVPQSVFRGCRFDGVDFRRANVGQSRFERCSFGEARIDAWNVTCAEFVDCRFTGPIARVRFYGRPWGHGAESLDPARTANEFRGNDFREAELIDVAFIMGIPIGAQRWPEGEEYVRLDRIHQRLTRARGEILRWRDLEARGAALDVVQAASFLYREQSEIVARRVDTTSPAPAEIQDRVWEVLASVL